MNVLEQMKSDVNSVIGLKVEYDYGGSIPIIDTIVDSKINEYQCELDSEKFTGKIYMISFSESPKAFYCVYKNNVKII